MRWSPWADERNVFTYSKPFISEWKIEFKVTYVFMEKDKFDMKFECAPQIF